jgi:hypothetical protein
MVERSGEMAIALMKPPPDGSDGSHAASAAPVAMLTAPSPFRVCPPIVPKPPIG